MSSASFLTDEVERVFGTTADDAQRGLMSEEGLDTLRVNGIEFLATQSDGDKDHDSPPLFLLLTCFICCLWLIGVTEKNNVLRKEDTEKQNTHVALLAGWSLA